MEPLSWRSQGAARDWTLAEARQSATLAAIRFTSSGTMEHALKSLLVGTAIFLSAADELSAQSEAPVVLMMTESYTAPGAFERDEIGRVLVPRQPVYSNLWTIYNRFGDPLQDNEEYVSKIQTNRISNREILELLVAEGVIPSIFGWSLKAVYPDDPLAEPLFYVTRPGFVPIYVGNYMVLNSFTEARAETVTAYTRYLSNGDTIDGGSDSGFARSEASAVITTRSVDPDDPEEAGTSFFPNGIWRRNVTLRPFGSGSNLALYYVFGSGSLTAISGYVLDVFEGTEGFDYYESLLEGSWSFSAARLVADPSLYPEAVEAAQQTQKPVAK